MLVCMYVYMQLPNIFAGVVAQNAFTSDMSIDVSADDGSDFNAIYNIIGSALTCECLLISLG